MIKIVQLSTISFHVQMSTPTKFIQVLLFNSF